MGASGVGEGHRRRRSGQVRVGADGGNGKRSRIRSRMSPNADQHNAPPLVPCASLTTCGRDRDDEVHRGGLVLPAHFHPFWPHGPPTFYTGLEDIGVGTLAPLQQRRLWLVLFER
jgi:hypothetical protein